MKGVEVINGNEYNISEYGFFCVTDAKHEGYQKKLDWLKKMLL